MADLRVGLVKVDDILFHPHNVRRDLGDLRALTNSIVRYGIMQPVVVEKYGDKLRLRAGHRRVAAARLAGLLRIPAVIHGEALEDKDWLLDINGTRSSVSIAEDTLIVIEDHHPDLWCEVSMTRHYDVDTARQHAKQILDRCDRIENLRAARLAEQTARAEQITGNSHEEIANELHFLANGGYLIDSGYHKRDEFSVFGGRKTTRLDHINPDMTSDRYEEELDAWWHARKAERQEAAK